MSLLKFQEDTVPNSVSTNLSIAVKALNDTKDTLIVQRSISQSVIFDFRALQAEIENYAARIAELESCIRSNDLRWEILRQRNPDYCAYESLKIIKKSKNTYQIIIKNLFFLNNNIRMVNFQIFNENNFSGIKLSKKVNEFNLIKRWPPSSKANNDLIVAPIGDEETSLARAETLLCLSTTDLNFIILLYKSVRQEIINLASLDSHSNVKFQPLLLGIEQIIEFITNLPPVFRYDSVLLKNEQLNKDYEHLWFELRNVSFGDLKFDKFEFRLSSAAIAEFPFGTHSKIEFPESGDVLPLKSWFPESSDDFGQKLEVRFALPSSMDTEIWNKLSRDDQNLFVALVDRLNAILKELEENSVSLQRKFLDWHVLSNRLKSILFSNVLQA
jgi:hypothetical protein